MKQNWYMNMITWREHHIKQKHFILLLSFFVGIGAALAAVILKEAIHLIQYMLTSFFKEGEANYWYLAYPFIGIVLASLFVRFIVKDDISHGVTKILYAISQHKAIIKLHNIWTSIVASSITIGFGGSVGAEAPIVLTGSAIGSNLGKFFKMDQKTMMLLIGCGAAGAIGGIFKAPIAGVMFTFEVLLIDMTMTSLVPLLISSVTATSVSYFLTGNEAMFHFEHWEPFTLSRIPFIIILGVVCGFVSLYFTRGMNRLEQVFKKLNTPLKKMLLGGAMLGVLIFLFPPLYGEGYNTIGELLNGNSESLFNRSLFYEFRDETWAIMLYLSLIVFFKIFASAATNGGGGTGGIFAPSLFVGCLTGFVVAEGFDALGLDIPKSNFAFAGMAGLMSGVMHAPFTGIFLIAELTGGYDLFMTLMITSTISYVTIKAFEPHSLYAIRLAQKGELLTHHKDKAVLTLLKMENVIETDLEKVSPEMSLGELVKVISQSHRNIFPVVDADGKLLGAVFLDEVRNIMFRPELYQRFFVKDLMVSPPARICVNMPMEKVMDVFEQTNAWNLPVVDENDVYMGYVSKSKIFNSYRHVLVHFSEE